ncbi:MAG: sulfatase-like hydrolase/transferase, partial [Phycisphaerae bacterium]
MTDRPNIVYIHSHDTGRYIQPYGYPVDTPRLQAFAEQGALFRKAFCAGPTCSPSRAALLSGQSPHNAGMLGLAHRGFCQMDFSRHIQHVLGEHGYETALSGMQHVADWRKQEPAYQQIGYDMDLGEWAEGRCRKWILGD